MSLRSLLYKDSIRYTREGVILTYIKRPLFRVVFWYRIVCHLKKYLLLKYSLGPIALLIFRHLELKYGVFLNTNTPIGSGLYIEHGGSVYINADYIGKNLTVFHEVTLGVSTHNKRPYVEDNVTIYMGAKVFGGVKLGTRCVVGVNSVVTKDVQPNQVVVGIPAKVIKQIDFL